MQARVIVASRSPRIADGLTYAVPKDMNLQPGMLVRVPLRGADETGIVLAIENDTSSTDTNYALKPILEVCSPYPLLCAAHLHTTHWMAETYRCTLRSALKPFMPHAQWSSIDTETAQGAQPQNDALLPTLSDAQQSALQTIRASSMPSLLFGITGSGKTEVYAHLIADAARQNRQSIVLLPEILLTHHLIERFERLIGREHIAVLHSKLTPAKRRDAWHKIRRGDVRLVIGSRSALFAPCMRLGLVVIDEEHEWTYKNEQAPRYNARDVARVLCAAQEAKLVLGSATPSLESWQGVRSGSLTIARINERYGKRPLPSVRIIDLAGVAFGSHYPFSPPLVEALRQRVESGEQSVLFLNRRGVASAMLCLECRQRIVSQQTQLPFTVHRGSNGLPYLMDHVAGIRAAVPDRCPHCSSTRLHAVGAGTQGIEETLHTLLPTARILRADSDTLKRPQDMQRLLGAMTNREADILLGTQTVVKGLDLPGVTLAAVPVADVGLSLPHFRAGERVFQLLAQLTGRSGRAVPGEVIIQTYRPSAPEIIAAAEHRTEDYLEAELGLRNTLHYPPCGRMIRFVFDPPNAEVRARALAQSILRVIQHTQANAIASCAPTFLGGGATWHVLLRGENIAQVADAIDADGATVDVDPVDLL